jgi:altronate dehydratase large subunit
MDTSGDDVEQLVALTVGGANVIAFTTGRGTPTASPIVPTVKISTTSQLAQRLRHDRLRCRWRAPGDEEILGAGRRLFELVVEVAAGSVTMAEEEGQRDFALPLTRAGA